MLSARMTMSNTKYRAAGNLDSYLLGLLRRMVTVTLPASLQLLLLQGIVNERENLDLESQQLCSW